MDKKPKVVPALLTNDTHALELMVKQTASFTDYAQVDIMDGIFVPSTSITAEHLTRLKMDFTWEAHLMVKDPVGYLDDFQKAGAQRIIFHYEATGSPEEVISHTRDLGVEIGLAVNPETPVSAFAQLADSLDNVLFLTVNPGYLFCAGGFAGTMFAKQNKWPAQGDVYQKYGLDFFPTYYNVF